MGCLRSQRQCSGLCLHFLSQRTATRHSKVRTLGSLDDIGSGLTSISQPAKGLKVNEQRHNLQTARIAVNDGGSRRCSNCDAVHVDVNVGRRGVGAWRHADNIPCRRDSASGQYRIFGCLRHRQIVTFHHHVVQRATVSIPAVPAAAIAALKAAELSDAPVGSAA